jgi:hypothetical protein
MPHISTRTTPAPTTKAMTTTVGIPPLLAGSLPLPTPIPGNDDTSPNGRPEPRMQMEINNIHQSNSIIVLPKIIRRRI